MTITHGFTGHFRPVYFACEISRIARDYGKAPSVDLPPERRAAAGCSAFGGETIAAATEELSASVGEISAQVQASAREAVAQAERTNATVEILDQTTSHIGEVVKMINAIAGQTRCGAVAIAAPRDQWYCIAQSLIRRV